MIDKLMLELLYESEFFTSYLKQFKKYLKNNPVILELGCNKGYLSRKMKDLESIVHSYDENYENIIIAKERNPDINFYTTLEEVQNIENIDGIIFNNCVYDLSINELQDMISIFDNLLDEQGYILLISNKLEDKELFKMVSNNTFEIVEELNGTNNWNFIIYKKNTIK